MNEDVERIRDRDDGCGSHSCVVRIGHLKGMGVNSSCRCVAELHRHHEERRLIRRLAKDRRVLLAAYDNEMRKRLAAEAGIQQSKLVRALPLPPNVEKALIFYADQENYITNVERDGGLLARAAIGSGHEGPDHD